MPTSPHPETLHTLAALAVVSSASVVGSLSLALGKRLTATLPYLVGLAAGALLGTAITHLLPEALAQLGSGNEFSALLILGFLSSFLIERLLYIVFRKGGTPNPEHLPPAAASIHHGHEHGRGTSELLARNILLGAAVHSFVDGLAIATAFSVGHKIGIATTIAVLIHEVPHHVADVGVLIYSGMTRHRAVFLNLIATCGCATGGLLVLLFGSHAGLLIEALLPITAANFIYISTAVLLPELQKEQSGRRSIAQIFCLLGGLAFMFWISRWSRG